MKSNSIKIRKDFKPLTTSCSLITLTPNSPAIQVFDGNTNECVPDRIGTPTVICPFVNVSENQNTFRNGRVNDLLGTIEWTANGVPIVSGVGGYTINTTDASSEKGSLTITKNVLPTERIILRFRGCIADTRLGINVWFIDEITLSTRDLSEDKYNISIVGDPLIMYNPFKDKLLEYDYKVAQGIIAANSAVRASCIDSESYLRTINFNVYRGKTKLTSLIGYNIRLYYRISGNTYTPIYSTDQDPSLISIDTATFSVMFDLRLIEKMDYMLILTINGKEKINTQFGIRRLNVKVIGETACGADITPGSDYVYNKALVSIDGKIIRYPETYCTIGWKTEVYDVTNGIKTVAHNEGEKAVISLAKTGIGDTDIDGWMNLYFNLTQKGAMRLLVDSDENYLTDESGNKLICN